jgi:hypothetical protein
MQGEDSPAAHKLADLYGLGSLFFELATGQGVTSLALAIQPNDIRLAMHRLRRRNIIEMEALRPNYSDAYQLLRDVLPKPIRDRGVGLVSQLCDPVPNNRLPKAGPGKRAARSTGLEWLLNQTDILIKLLRTQSPRTVMTRRQGIS